MVQAYLLELKRQLLFLAHGWQCALHNPPHLIPVHCTTQLYNAGNIKLPSLLGSASHGATWSEAPRHLHARFTSIC